MPALKDRREDIPALVEHFVRRHARQFGKIGRRRLAGIHAPARAYAWPGNIRELRTVLERAILVAKSSVLEIDEELLDERTRGRQLPSDFAAGIRRHGRGLAREAPAPRPSRGREADSAADAAGADAREQLVRRFQREAQVTARLAVAAYRAALRLRRERQRQLLLRDGAAAGSRPPAHRESLRTAACRAGHHAPAAGVPIARRSARARTRAPRHQAGEPLRGPAGNRVRLSEGARLRDCEGSARAGARHRMRRCSAPNPRQGTPAFMAPEVDLRRAPIDGRADLYSLACAGLLGAHRAAGVPGEHAGANAPAPCADAARVRRRSLRASDSRRRWKRC